MGRPKKNAKQGEKNNGEPGFFDISQETKNSIWGVFSFIFAVLSVLSFVHKAGAAGEFFNTLAHSLFGWGFFIIPVAFAMLGVSFIKSLSRKIYLSAVAGTAMFVCSSLAIFYVLGTGDFHTRLLQGGYLGIILGYPLLRMIGFIASLITLIALLVISVLLALNVPLYQLVSNDEEEKKKEEDAVIIKKGNEMILPGADKKIFPPTKPEPLRATQNTTVKTDLSDKEFVIKNLKMGNWILPSLDMLNKDKESPASGDIQANAQIIKRTLSNFGIDVEMGEVSIGPTVTQYTLRPAVGVKLARISTLNPDLSLALAAHPIRIEAPIPGKSLVGIEVPNKKTAIVGLRDMFEAEDFQKSKYVLPLALGRNVAGEAIYAGLEKMPHILIAGTTGSGKSVAIHSIIVSLLYKYSPEMLKFILIDPKKVEMPLYDGIPHLITPVITDNKKVLGALRWAVSEMDRRYTKLSEAKVRDILGYNEHVSRKDDSVMPYIVIVIDELADLMASYGRDVEAAIVRLAQMARAVGIHLVLATQRPSVNVITGLIKANISSRVALRVISQIDSRTIIDMAGAEKLLGYGDMLFVTGESATPRRLQGPLVNEKEVKAVVAFVKDQGEKLELGLDQVDLSAKPSNGAGGFAGDGDQADDDMYEEAKQVVIESGKASASLLQRRLRVGYARAARLLDILEEKGIIGPGDGAKPREVYAKSDDGKIGPSGMLDPSAAMAINADTREAETS